MEPFVSIDKIGFHARSVGIDWILFFAWQYFMGYRIDQWLNHSLTRAQMLARQRLGFKFAQYYICRDIAKSGGCMYHGAILTLIL